MRIPLTMATAAVLVAGVMVGVASLQSAPDTGTVGIQPISVPAPAGDVAGSTIPVPTFDPTAAAQPGTTTPVPEPVPQPAPAEPAPAEQALVQQAPAEQAPAEQAPVQQAPAPQRDRNGIVPPPPVSDDDGDADDDDDDRDDDDDADDDD